MHGLGSSPCGECALKKGVWLPHGGELLSNCPRHNHPEHITDHDPTHSAIWLGQSCHPTHSHGLQHLLGYDTPGELTVPATFTNNLVHVVSLRGGFTSSHHDAAPLGPVRRFFSSKLTKSLLAPPPTRNDQWCFSLLGVSVTRPSTAFRFWNPLEQQLFPPKLVALKRTLQL